MRFAVRGYMLDVSRDRVPTMAALRRLVDQLGRLGYNSLELYVEHTFAHAGHDVVWRDASPLTADELAELDGRCRDRGITLVPNRNSLGHMERWLAHEEYLPRAELPSGDVVVDGHSLGATTLEPTAENAAFALGLVRELTDILPADRVNIGCDEPWELGRGRSRDACERDGLGVVYARYVAEVARGLIADGKRVEVWAEVFGNHPEGLGLLPPEGLIPVVWQYDSPEAIARTGGQPNGFGPRSAELVARGLDFWVAPGTGTWGSVTGRLRNVLENIADACVVGADHDCEGILLTSWGDNGAWEPMALQLPALAACALQSVGGSSPTRQELVAAIDSDVLSRPCRALAEAIVQASGAADALGVEILNSSVLAHALRRGGRLPADLLPPDQRPGAAGIAACRAEYDAASALLDSARPAAEDADYVDELRQAIALGRFALDLLERPVTGPGEDARHDEWRRLLAEQRRVWLLNSRPGGLDDSLAKVRPFD